MRYRLTALTPLLVGDGQKLSPIDYMVWKDQINVLDQRRIFKLLAKGSRLEGYLSQLRKADKLDFASWGGFAQNYAERRIPFEHPSCTAQWNEARTDDLHIPTFSTTLRGPYIPATAIKGALRTSVAAKRWNAGVIQELATRMEGDRPLRHPGEAAESMTIGAGGNDAMRIVSLGDSAPVDYTNFRIYLLRVSTLSSRSEGKYDLNWKAAPTFAEMVVPGAVFTGSLKIIENARARTSFARILDAANEHAAQLVEAHSRYAEIAKLQTLSANLARLSEMVRTTKNQASSCVVNLGWGSGFLGKAAFLDTANDDYRNLLRRLPYYERAIRSGMPFPKTRRVIYQENQPATLPGWALLTFE